MSGSEPPHIDHGPSQRGLDHTVAHTDNEQQEEGEGVSGSVEDSYNGEEDLGSDVGTVAVLVIFANVNKESATGNEADKP